MLKTRDDPEMGFEVTWESAYGSESPEGQGEWRFHMREVRPLSETPKALFLDRLCKSTHALQESACCPARLWKLQRKIEYNIFLLFSSVTLKIVHLSSL